MNWGLWLTGAVIAGVSCVTGVGIGRWLSRRRVCLLQDDLQLLVRALARQFPDARS